MTEAQLHGFIDSLKGKVNPFSIETTMKIFFEWSRARGYFKESPTAHWKKRGSKGRNKDYYSVETFARML